MSESLTKEEIERIVKETVKEALLSLGVITSTDNDIVSLQGDMAWLRKQRIATEEISKWVRRGLITTVLSGILYVFWEGLKLALKH
jgi:hypothetical protein